MLEISPEDRNPVAAVANWRTRIRSEHNSAKNWGNEWGFLLGGGQENADGTLQHSAALVAGVEGTPFRSTVAANLRNAGGRVDGDGLDSMDKFMQSYIKSHSKSRYLATKLSVQNLWRLV